MRVGVLEQQGDRVHQVVVDRVALQPAHQHGVDDRHRAQEDLAGAAVDRDHVALRDHRPAAHLHGARLDVHDEVLGATDAGATHASGDDRRVRRPAAAARQDPAGRHHAGQVVGGGLLADQHDVLAPGGPLGRRTRVEHGLADGGAGGGVHPRGETVAGRVGVEPGEHQPGQLGTGDPLQRLVEVDQALGDHVGGHPERRLGRALPDPGLQHPELAGVDRELDVAHVEVVALQRGHDVEQLGVRRGVDLLQVGQRHGVADAGHDVLTLGVLQVVAVDPRPAGGGVPGEAHARAGAGAAVAEHHGLHVDGGAEVLRDALLAAVEHGPLGVPGVEDRPHREVHLVARVLGERASRLLLDQLLVTADQVLEVLVGEVHVLGSAALLLDLVEDRGEGIGADAHHGAAEHLQQPTVGVEGEARVVALPGQAVHGGVVQPDVEDRLHHAGHRELRPGAHRHQKRVLRVAEVPSHGLLEVGEVPGDLVGEVLGLGRRARGSGGMPRS